MPNETAYRAPQNIDILFEEGLSLASDLRRRPEGIIEKMNWRLSKSLYGSHREVRGIGLAADHLVRALASHSSASQLRLRFEPETEAPARSYLHDLKSYVTRNVTLTAASLAGDGGISRETGLPDAWLNLSPYQTRWGGAERSQAVRLCSGGAPYPILTLLHGLSAHGMLLSVFFPLLLGGSLPCDSLIATSAAAADATRNILSGVSEAFASQYGVALTYRGRIDTIPLCVDTTVKPNGTKAQIRKRLGVDADGFTMLYLGRISPLKADLRPFLPVFSSLRKKHSAKKLTWIVAGTADEGYIEELLRLAKSLGVAEHLKIMLHVDEETKQNLLHAADAFFSPSDSVQESCGLTPLEAMVAGLPQVVADWDGYRDTVKDGETGFLLPTYWTECDADLERTGSVLGWSFDHLRLGQSVAVDVQAAEVAIERLLTNPALCARMAEASRARAIQKYSYKVIAEQYVRLMGELGVQAKSFEPAELPAFTQPAYTRNFRAYASRWLSGDAYLTLLSNRLDSANESALGYLPDGDRAIVVSMIEVLRKAPEKALTLDALCTAAGSEREGPIDLRWHAMWLIKQGWVTPVDLRWL